MYSLLHDKIGRIFGKENYAVTSCLAKKVYLPYYRLTLAQSLIKQHNGKTNKESVEKIRQLCSYHKSYVEKIEKRTLSSSEIDNMVKFYESLKKFVQDKKITLVLLHNDTRWYHAVAIEICRELGLPYLVSEQGLIRPHTTVLDNSGVNGYASNNYRDEIYYKKLGCKKVALTGSHESIVSMIFFFIFLSLFTLERLLGRRSILPYLHNNYKISKYATRLKNRIVNKKKDMIYISEPYILLILQLENDSQILVHSRYENNQSLIDDVIQNTKNLGCRLFIKKHPLDTKDYTIMGHAAWVDAPIKSLSRKAELVVTVNSSAAVDVIKTKTPMFLLGDSIYAQSGVARRINCIDIEGEYKRKESSVSIKSRKNFINYLKFYYLLPGSGFSYDKEILKNKVISLIE